MHFWRRFTLSPTNQMKNMVNALPYDFSQMQLFESKFLRLCITVYHGEISSFASESYIFPLWDNKLQFQHNFVSCSFFHFLSEAITTPSQARTFLFDFLTKLSESLITLSESVTTILSNLPPNMWQLPLIQKSSHILWSSPKPSTAFEAFYTLSDPLLHPLRSSAHFPKPHAQYYPNGNEYYDKTLDGVRVNHIC